MVTDLIWMGRFVGAERLDLTLDMILADDFAALEAMRVPLDAEIVAFAERLTDADLAATISYTRASSPEKHSQPLWPALVHLFNHQTHHRGQVHALLTRLTGEAPPLDLLFYQREAKDGV